MNDNVNHPAHYIFNGIETIDYIDAVLGPNAKYYYIGNILKYISRWEGKGDSTEQFKKANWYLMRLILKEEGKVVNPSKTDIMLFNEKKTIGMTKEEVELANEQVHFDNAMNTAMNDMITREEMEQLEINATNYIRSIYDKQESSN